MIFRFSFLISACLICGACGAVQSSDGRAATVAPASAVAPLPDSRSETDGTIRFLEKKIKDDPEDFSTSAKLAGLYLQKVRETGDVTFLNLAFVRARASLESVPDVRNSGGLAALAQAEFASHDFKGALAHAMRLAELEPSKSYPQGILGDAHLELGEYAEAEKAYKKMVVLDGGISHASETRIARLALLKGDNTAAQKHLVTALSLVLDQPLPQAETVAWLHWQLGETAFATGDYAVANAHFQNSLTTFPNYYRAVASLGKTLAAEGDTSGAIEQMTKAVSLFPDPGYIATLGDLQKLGGRDDESKRQFDLVEQIGRLNQLNGALYNRQLALFYADHDIKQVEAYELAAAEYKNRRDIYGADTLAWTALKANKLDEARGAINEALRQGTSDAKLFYHAGMIANASGDDAAAKLYIRRALDLNPNFDPLQASLARKVIEDR